MSDVDVNGRFWLTPPALLKQLEDEFHFDFDAAPYPRPEGFDSLTMEWGKSTYVNPPIGHGSSLTAWVHKSIEEQNKGNNVVMLLPFQRWFSYLLKAGAEFRHPGPIRFLNPQGKRAPSSGGGRIPDIVVVLRPQFDKKVANPT